MIASITLLTTHQPSYCQIACLSFRTACIINRFFVVVFFISLLHLHEMKFNDPVVYIHPSKCVRYSCKIKEKRGRVINLSNDNIKEYTIYVF